VRFYWRSVRARLTVASDRWSKLVQKVTSWWKILYQVKPNALAFRIICTGPWMGSATVKWRKALANPGTSWFGIPNSRHPSASAHRSGPDLRLMASATRSTHKVRLSNSENLLNHALLYTSRNVRLSLTIANF
jgi:hypothetical protein